MPKTLKFNVGVDGGYCVLGAVGRAFNRIQVHDYPINGNYFLMEFGNDVTKRTGITTKIANSLITLNDNYHWKRLTNKLVKLGLYKKLLKYSR